MEHQRVLLLHKRESASALLRSAILGERCKVEEACFDDRKAAAPTGGYCLVVFEIERLAKSFLEVLRAWHDEAPATTLIVVGNRTALFNRLAVLETGAAAYLTKHSVAAELAARVRAALLCRRGKDRTSRQFAFGAGMIDLEARMIRMPAGYVRLTPTECDILQHLTLYLNQTVPFGRLVRMLWGTDPQKGVHSLRVFIRKLRQKLEPDPARPIYLVTEPTIGYRLQALPDGDGASAGR